MRIRACSIPLTLWLCSLLLVLNNSLPTRSISVVQALEEEEDPSLHNNDNNPQEEEDEEDDEEGEDDDDVDGEEEDDDDDDEEWLERDRLALAACRHFPTWKDEVDGAYCSQQMGWDDVTSNDTFVQDDEFYDWTADILPDDQATLVMDCLQEKLASRPFDETRCANEDDWEPSCELEPVATSHYSNWEEGDVVVVENILTEQEAFAVQSLSQCMNDLLPQRLPFYEERLFGDVDDPDNYGLYKEGGGNLVTYLGGFLQLYLPGVASSVYNAVTAAYDRAGWENYVNPQHFEAYPSTGLPHPTTLGIRTTELLKYNPTGRLSLHADADSIFTIAIALSDPSDFEGGHFHLESDHVLFKAPRLSGVVFFSEAQHALTPITAGTRQVFATELWDNHDVPLGLPRPTPEDFETWKQDRIEVLETGSRGEEKLYWYEGTLLHEEL